MAIYGSNLTFTISVAIPLEGEVFLRIFIGNLAVATYLICSS